MFDEQKPNAEGSYIILGAKIHNATFTIEKKITHPSCKKHKSLYQFIKHTTRHKMFKLLN